MNKSGLLASEDPVQPQWRQPAMAHCGQSRTLVQSRVLWEHGQKIFVPEVDGEGFMVDDTLRLYHWWAVIITRLRRFPLGATIFISI